MKNKRKMIISSIVILLPIVVGILFWDQLPEKIAVHWNAAGEANGWSNRITAIFRMPLFILLAHWICMLVTWKDAANKSQNSKVMDLLVWICPFVSLVANGIVYATAFGINLNISGVVFAFSGLLFMCIGNYLPKCKQNTTIGIKIKWTLLSEENWNATHRIAGKVWFVGGALMLFSICIPEKYLFLLFIMLLSVMALIPILYSSWYHKKECGLIK